MTIGGLCIAKTRIHLSFRFAKELLPERSSHRELAQLPRGQGTCPCRMTPATSPEKAGVGRYVQSHALSAGGASEYRSIQSSGGTRQQRHSILGCRHPS